jgi:hypothetical protein
MANSSCSTGPGSSELAAEATAQQNLATSMWSSLPLLLPLPMLLHATTSNDPSPHLLTTFQYTPVLYSSICPSTCNQLSNRPSIPRCRHPQSPATRGRPALQPSQEAQLSSLRRHPTQNPAIGLAPEPASPISHPNGNSTTHAVQYSQPPTSPLLPPNRTFQPPTAQPLNLA